MTRQFDLNRQQLAEFAPESPILAFIPASSGSPSHDWCAHLQAFPRYRRELEEFAVLGDAVIRIADGEEPAPLDRVKILSLVYAVKTLKNETDAKEFVRCVKAIAAPDAGQYELEQIASYYYGEIRRRGNTGEVLKEMGWLGMQMQAVTATVEMREIEFTESTHQPPKLSLADEKRVEAAQRNLPPVPAPTPVFDAELTHLCARVGGSKITRARHDEFAAYYLEDDGKTLDELDADYRSFDKLRQYDENGIVGFSMAGDQHAVVVYDFHAEVDASYLPPAAQGLARDLSRLFVGHEIGGTTAQKGRQTIQAHRLSEVEIASAKKGNCVPATKPPALEKFSRLPFTDEEFEDRLNAELDSIYSRRVCRSVRRITCNKHGVPIEYVTTREVNPDFEERQYAAAVYRILWQQMYEDFHLRSLRRETYQRFHTAIRLCTDSADVARLKKEAYTAFKEQKKLTLKEFTALNTAAKMHEARLFDKISPFTRKTLADINRAASGRLRFLKFFLYNDASVQELPRQEKQRLWQAVRTREKGFSNTGNTSGCRTAKTSTVTERQRLSAVRKQIVTVKPQ